MPRSNQTPLRLFRGPAARAPGSIPLQPLKREPTSRKLLSRERQSPSRRFFLDRAGKKTAPRQKALLVENDDLTIEVIQSRMLQLGFGVSVARSGPECLQRLRRASFDVLILSAGLISESDEVLVGLRNARLKPSAITIIAGGDESSIKELDIPHDLHLPKPVNVDELVNWVSGEWFCSSF